MLLSLCGLELMSSLGFGALLVLLFPSVVVDHSRMANKRGVNMVKPQIQSQRARESDNRNVICIMSPPFLLSSSFYFASTYQQTIAPWCVPNG